VSEDHDIVMMTENFTCENTVFYVSCLHSVKTAVFFHTNSQ